MKKVISVVLALVMVLSLSVCAFAAEKNTFETGTYKVMVENTAENYGMGWVLIYDGDEVVDFVVLIDNWYGYIYLDNSKGYTVDMRNVKLVAETEENTGISGKIVDVFDLEDLGYNDAECFA